MIHIRNLLIFFTVLLAFAFVSGGEFSVGAHHHVMSLLFSSLMTLEFCIGSRGQWCFNTSVMWPMAEKAVHQCFLYFVCSKSTLKICVQSKTH